MVRRVEEYGGSATLVQVRATRFKPTLNDPAARANSGAHSGPEVL